MKYRIGYFHIKGTLSHVLDEYGKLLCKSKVRADKKFYWIGNGVENWKWVGCRTCRQLAREIYENKNKEEKETR